MTLRIVPPEDRRILTLAEQRQLMEALTLVGLPELAGWVDQSPGVSLMREPF